MDFLKNDLVAVILALVMEALSLAIAARFLH